MSKQFAWASLKPGRGNIGCIVSVLGILGSEGGGMAMVATIPLFLLMIFLILVARKLDWRKAVLVLDILGILLFLGIVAAGIEFAISYFGP